MEMLIVTQLLPTFRWAPSCAPDQWLSTAGKVAFQRIVGNVRRLFGCHTGMSWAEARDVNNILKWRHSALQRRISPARMPSMRNPAVDKPLCLYPFSPTFHLRFSLGVIVSKNIPLNTTWSHFDSPLLSLISTLDTPLSPFHQSSCSHYLLSSPTDSNNQWMFIDSTDE